jgi:hypothetical protein
LTFNTGLRKANTVRQRRVISGRNRAPKNSSASKEELTSQSERGGLAVNLAADLRLRLLTTHDLTHRSTSLSMAPSRQYNFAFEATAAKRVCQIVVRVSADAAGALKFTGSAQDLISILLDVRTLVKGLYDRVAALKLPRAGPGPLPAFIGHVFVFANAVLGVFLLGSVIGYA